MNKTNAEFVSRISGDLKGFTKDGRVPRRLIISIGQDKARFLMAQKLDEMTLFREEGLISTIPCFEMESVPLIECNLADVPNCKSVMKSVNKIPEGLFGKNGSGIIYVYTLDNSKRFDFTTLRKYRDIKKMRYIREAGMYYTIMNGHLYLLDSETELVGMQMIALKKEEIAKISGCISDELKCKSSWESEFVCPDRFYDLVVKDTIAELVGTFRTIVEDANPNLDPTQKGKTTN
jgi:hypothetical protein